MNTRLAPLFSSARDDWETPPELFAALDREFHFTLDAAANAANAKCQIWFGPGSPIGVEDALTARWFGTVWLNPPYGREIPRFVAKAHAETRAGHCTAVALIPARTDTEWWHAHVMRAGEIRLLPGRLRFVGAKYPAPFPSAIVVWRPEDGDVPEPQVFSWDWRRAA